MTDKRKLEVLAEIKRIIEHHPMLPGGTFKDECLTVLEDFKDELKTKQYEVGERAEYKFYGKWISVHVMRLGKVRVGIKIPQFSDIKYVSPKMLRKVEK
jgi:hypothetical protein